MTRLRLIARLRLAGRIAAAAGAAAGAIWLASATFAGLRADVEANVETIADHEARLRCNEARIERIDANTSWMRQEMERR